MDKQSIATEPFEDAIQTHLCLFLASNESDVDFVYHLCREVQGDIDLVVVVDDEDVTSDVLLEFLPFVQFQFFDQVVLQLIVILVS